MVVTLHQLTAAIYLVAALVAVLRIALAAPRLGRLAVGLLAVGALAHAAAFAELHMLRPPPPLTDLPAAISLMAWIAVIFCLALQTRRGRMVGLIAVVAPLAFLGVFYSSLALPHVLGAARPSAGSWPHLHVILASAGLALLGVAGLAGLLFLGEDRMLKRKRPVLWGSRLPSLETLDRVNLLALALGFPLLTLGVIAGMLWSRSATGHLLSHDPHETWSLVGWAIYGVLATARFGGGWRGREAAASAALGFVFLLFAVVGVR